MSTSVNLSLTLSSSRQLELLEEILSLLHQESSGDLDPRESDASKSQHEGACRTSVASQAGELEEAHLAAPRPPESPPSAQARLGLVLRQRRGQVKRDPVVDIDPSAYLNEAELALIGNASNAPLSFVSPRRDPAMFTGGGDATTSRKTSSELGILSRGRRLSAARRAMTMAAGVKWPECREAKAIDLSQYWLREMDNWKLQKWLENKNREHTAKSRREGRQRRLDRRTARTRAREASERATKASEAYQKWLKTKQGNQKTKERKRLPASPLSSAETKHATPTGNESRLTDTAMQEKTLEEQLSKQDREKRSKDHPSSRKREISSCKEDMASVVRQLRRHRIQEGAESRGKQQPTMMEHISSIV